MKKGLTELVFILDKSGSMGGLEKDTIGGFNADRAQNYHADSEGVELNFCVMSEAVASFREGAAMPEGWNDKIQKDFKQRGGRK